MTEEEYEFLSFLQDDVNECQSELTQIKAKLSMIWSKIENQITKPVEKEKDVKRK